MNTTEWVKPTDAASLIEAVRATPGESAELVIQFEGGAFTRRQVNVCGDGVDVFHGISDTWEEFETVEAWLEMDGILAEAMSKGALFVRPA